MITFVINRCTIEGISSCQHNEEYDSAGEDINVLSHIFLALDDLRSDIYRCAHLLLFDLLGEAGEAEISELDLEPLINEHVLYLYVPVGDLLRLYVLQGVYHLHEKGASITLRQVAPVFLD